MTPICQFREAKSIKHDLIQEARIRFFKGKHGFCLELAEGT